MGHRGSEFDGKHKRHGPDRKLEDWERVSDVKERRRDHREHRHSQLARLKERLDGIDDAYDSDELEQRPIRKGAADLRKKKRRMRGRLHEMHGHDDHKWQEALGEFEEDWKGLEDDWDDLSKKVSESE